MPERHALIIGSMKCGTTSAFHYLSAHPEVAPARVKEPEFFTDHWERGWQWYEGLWNQRVTRSTWALEASTGYTKLPSMPDAAERVSRTRADYRFIYLLRDPIARIQSHRRHYHLRQKDPRLRTHMVEISRYAMQLDAYRRRFSQEQLLLLSFEALRDRPEATLRRICEFLEIDPSIRFPVRRTAFNRSAPDGRGYRLLTGVPGLSRLARALPVSFRRAVRNRLAEPPPELPELRPEERNFIDGALRDDLARLRDEYGFDTSVWRS